MSHPQQHPNRQRHLLYGLTVASDLTLHTGRPALPDGPADLTVRRGPEVSATAELPAGEVWLDYATGDDHWYTLTRRDDGSHLFRIYGLCEFVISADLSEVEFLPWPDLAPGMDSVMITGTLLAAQLYLRGHLVLHSSAVEVDGQAVAFVGHSGMGKSTTASLLAAAGGVASVTDDVLRVDLESGGRPRARLGPAHLRLRSGAQTVQTLFATRPDLSTSADARALVRPVGEAVDGLPLGAIVVPQPTRDSNDVVVERLTGISAVMTLLQFPRLLGWRADQVVSDGFAQAGAIAASTPIVTLTIPWGPPFADDLPERLLEAVRGVLAPTQPAQTST